MQILKTLEKFIYHIVLNFEVMKLYNVSFDWKKNLSDVFELVKNNNKKIYIYNNLIKC